MILLDIKTGKCYPGTISERLNLINGASLALSALLMETDKDPNFIRPLFTEAAQAIARVQNNCSALYEEAENLEGILEEYNVMRDFINSKELNEEFKQFRKI